MVGALLLACVAITCNVGIASAGVGDLGSLLAIENAMLTTLRSYLSARDFKTNSLRSLLEDLSREHAESANDAHQANPITSYSLVKRLSGDWRRAYDRIAAEPAVDEMVKGGPDAVPVPKDVNVDDVASTLVRLQETYRLDTESLARGELNGVQVADELDADDCFDLGKRAFLAEDYDTAVSWMLETLARHDESTKETITEILGYLSYCRYKQGRLHEALSLTQEMLEQEPDHAIARRNMLGYFHGVGEAALDAQPPQPPQPRPSDIDIYKSLCRGEFKMDESLRSTLRCRYVDHGSWFLRLARLKEEEAFLEPRIVIYHGVISRDEIRQVTAKALPRLEAAGVLARNGSRGPVVEPYRIAKSTWFSDGDLPAAVVLNRRVSHMTRLDLATGEQLQVGQYGVGGHYEPHCDHVKPDFLINATGSFSHGNRIATVLFYMNDVEQGGATVFTELKLTLWPVEGAAVVWHNLHRDGVGDARTRHAGCPVLAGTKWVINKWLHERGQEFIRPCGLSQDSKRVPSRRLIKT